MLAFDQLLWVAGTVQRNRHNSAPVTGPGLWPRPEQHKPEPAQPNILVTARQTATGGYIMPYTVQSFYYHTKSFKLSSVSTRKTNWKGILSCIFHIMKRSLWNIWKLEIVVLLSLFSLWVWVRSNFLIENKLK